MSEGITDEVLAYMAQKAYWFIDLHFHDRSDSTVFTGDGVDDIDSLLTMIDRNPKMSMVMDVGQVTSIYRPVVLEDIVALRAAYVTAWGETDRPAFWNDPKGVPCA